MAKGLLSLLVCLAFAPPALAKDIIRDKDVIKEVGELKKLLDDVRAGKMKAEQVVSLYGQRAQAETPKRKAALAAYMFGFVLQQVPRKMEPARQAYERALKRWPDFPAAHVAVALILAASRDLPGAKARLEAALRIDPRHVESMIHLARLYAVEGKYKKAIKLYKESIDEKPESGAWTGLAAVYVQLYKKAFGKEEKAGWAKKAIGAANGWFYTEPGNGNAHLFRGRVYQDLGQNDRAAGSFEDSYANSSIKDKHKVICLKTLVGLYAQGGNVKGVQRTIDRMLTHESITGEAREQLVKMRKDLVEKGKTAFLVWQAEELLQTVENDGKPQDVRRQALRGLLEFLTNPLILGDKDLEKLAEQVFRNVFKTLIEAPPDLIIEILTFLRTNLADPKLIRILVHFIYPFDNDRITPEVRVEAVRTLAKVAGTAAVPALIYSTRDDAGAVAREVDKALGNVCEQRSPIGGGVEPLTPAQLKQMRIFWLRYAQSEEGADMLATSFERLRKIVRTDPTQSPRDQRSAPMVDHAINLVLLDNDMDWKAWAPAYRFLVDYWQKDFRPVKRRDKPVEPFERKSIVKEIEAFWAQPTDPQAKPTLPSAPGEEKKKPREKTKKPK